MKKLLLIPFLFLSAIAFSQVIVNRAGPANTVADQRIQGTKNLYIPRYTDTTTANIAGANLSVNNLGIDSCGAIIYTRNPQALWYRACKPVKHWERLSSLGEGGGTTNIEILNDSTLLICNAQGVCDTFHFNSTVTNINNVFLVGHDSIAVCHLDTVTRVQVCDTISLGGTPTQLPAFQNGVNSKNGVVEFGSDPGIPISNLLHNTTLDAQYFQMTFRGQSVFEPPYMFYQNQFFPSGTAIASFQNHGDYFTNTTTPHAITDRLVINYTGAAYQWSGPYIKGYLGDSVNAYMINTNGRGFGSFGWYQDDTTAKTTVIALHTQDTNILAGVSIYAAPKVHSTGNNIMGAHIYDYKVVDFNTDLSSNFLGKVYLTNGRLEPDTALVVAANDLTLGLGNVMLVSGNTQINAITTSGWQAGSSPVYLVFSGTPAVKNNTTGGAGTAKILLAGGVDFIASAGDILTILYDGTQWRETARRLASSVGTGGYFAPDQTSFATTTHDQNFHQFFVNNQGYTQYTAGIGANQSIVAWDSTETFLQTNKTNFRTIIGTSRNLNAIGGAQFTTYNTSTTKGTAVLAYPDSIEMLTTTGSDVVPNYTKPLIKITRDSILIKNSPRSTDTLLLTIGTDSVVRTRGISTISSLINANEGLIDSSGYIQLGSPSAATAFVFNNRFIELQGNTLRFSANGGVNAFQVVDTGAGNALVATTTNTNGTAFFASTTTGNGNAINATTVDGNGIKVTANGNGIPGTFIANPSSTNTIVPVMLVQRFTSGTAADGIGGSIDFYTESSSGAARISNQIISKWPTSNDGTRTSQMDIVGINSTASNTIMSAYGSGVVGIGISSGYTGTRLEVVDNSVAGASIVKVTTTSTAAAGSNQRGIEVSMAGANTNGGQNTYGGYFVNTHTGSGSGNFGLIGIADNAASNNYGVSGQTSTAGAGNAGVRGVSLSTGYGVMADNSSTGSGLRATAASSSAYAMEGQVSTASTNTILSIAKFTGITSGTPANGIGSALELQAQASSGNQIASVWKAKWADVTNATRTSVVYVDGVNNATTDDLLTMGDRVTLTESSATTFASITVASGKIAGGEIIVTIEANDGTDFQSRTQRFIYTAENKAGTTTITIGTPEEVVAVSTGTLTSTITAVDAGSGVVQFKSNATSSLTQTTLRATYFLQKNF